VVIGKLSSWTQSPLLFLSSSQSFFSWFIEISEARLFLVLDVFEFVMLENALLKLNCVVEYFGLK